ncbi:VanZ family protein [Butyrivibrio sp. FCS006]|uniref:VanZ family protein n=1 Tax=Butyrivibrio sp. FCS006 TaxID=1280684 RepID=UPI0012DDB9A5|nr:VanZ family protein [Butyrivibrio sp. FCS006]
MESLGMILNMNSGFIHDFAVVLKKETEGINIADHLVMLVVETLVILLLGQAFLKKGWISNKKVIYIMLVLAYINMLFSITIFNRMPGSREGIIHLNINLGFGLRTGHPSSWGLTFSLLNILLFIPFGILAYPIFRSYKRVLRILVVTMAGALTSLGIECIQLVTGRGMFEISDFVTNTAGSFIGVVIAAVFYHIKERVMKGKATSI